MSNQFGLVQTIKLCAAALTTAQWYCTRLKKISDALKLFSFERHEFFHIVFLKYRDKLSTTTKKFRLTWDTVWHEIFEGSNFYDFCDFSSDPQKQVPAKKWLNENIFSATIYPRVLNIIWLKLITQKYSTKKSCLDSPLQFRNKTVLHSVRIP